jgi:hypothetical protein
MSASRGHSVRSTWNAIRLRYILFDYFDRISFGFLIDFFFKLGNPYDVAAAYGYEGYGAEYAGYGPGEEGYFGYGGGYNGGYGGGSAPITIEIEAK